MFLCTGDQGVMGQDVEGAQHAVGRLGQGADGVGREEVVGDTGQSEAMEEIGFDLFGLEGVHAHPGGDTPPQGGEVSQAQALFPLVLSGENQDEMALTIERACHQEAQFMEALMGEVMSLIHHEKRLDVPFEELMTGVGDGVDGPRSDGRGLDA